MVGYAVALLLACSPLHVVSQPNGRLRGGAGGREGYESRPAHPGEMPAESQRWARPGAGEEQDERPAHPDGKDRPGKRARWERPGAAHGYPAAQHGGSAGKSIAMGCTALLKAQNDGKMQWFESQMWYKKALQMCMSLSRTQPEEIDEKIHKQAGALLSGQTSMELLKDSCMKLAQTPHDSPVRSKKWFPKAEHMCATVRTSSAAELQQLLHQQEHKAESASGQLIRQTCAKFQEDRKMGGLKAHQKEAWLQPMQKMCSKMGRQQVDKSKIGSKCQWLAKMKAAGRAKQFETQAWYKHLDATCKWLGNRKEGSKKGPQGQHPPSVIV